MRAPPWVERAIGRTRLQARSYGRVLLTVEDGSFEAYLLRDLGDHVGTRLEARSLKEVPLV